MGQTIYFFLSQTHPTQYVSHPGETKHKTVLLKKEVNAFSNREYLNVYFKKKLFK